MANSKNIIVGITGGIGSGKTTVSKFFIEAGMPVYYADKEAKALMNCSKTIRRKLIEIFGNDAYINDKINRSFLRQQIFENKTLLKKMNAIVHPKVASHFEKWVKKQDAPYILKEVAIIFENNLQHQYDYIITVIADKEQRIKRVMKRDNVSKSTVISIINNQLSDTEKVKKSNFVIINNDLDTAKQKVLEIHNKLLTIVKTP